MKLLALLVGNPLYALIGLFALLTITNGYTAYKAYSFGAAIEKVKCEKRVAVIQQQVADANAKVLQATNRWKADLDKLAAEYAVKAEVADKTEELARAQIKEYEDEINAHANNACLPTDSDLKWLH